MVWDSRDIHKSKSVNVLTGYPGIAPIIWRLSARVRENLFFNGIVPLRFSRAIVQLTKKWILYFVLTRRAVSNGKLLLFMVHLNNYYYMWRSLANAQTFKTYARRRTWFDESWTWSWNVGARAKTAIICSSEEITRCCLLSGNYSVYCFGVNAVPSPTYLFENPNSTST